VQNTEDRYRTVSRNVRNSEGELVQQFDWCVKGSAGGEWIGEAVKTGNVRNSEGELVQQLDWCVKGSGVGVGEWGGCVKSECV
jgi:hypothetical protein